jgi:type IV secretory pathway TrbL component
MPRQPVFQRQVDPEAARQAGRRAAFKAPGGSSTAISTGAEGVSARPDWARKFRQAQAMREDALTAARTVQSVEGGASMALTSIRKA